jgi:hypothetical protein
MRKTLARRRPAGELAEANRLHDEIYAALHEGGVQSSAAR